MERKERRVVKGTKRVSQRLAKRVMLWGMLDDGGVDVNCKTLYIQRVGWEKSERSKSFQKGLLGEGLQRSRDQRKESGLLL
jgi:hypothetical protein